MKPVPIITIILLAAVFWSCGRKSPENPAQAVKPAPAAAGTPASGAVEAAAPMAATIAQLLTRPKAYAGKEVSVKGIFGGICCPSDFKLKDGVDTIEVYSTPTCPMPPESKLRSRVTVRGTVLVRGGQPAITARELKFE